MGIVIGGIVAIAVLLYVINSTYSKQRIAEIRALQEENAKLKAQCDKMKTELIAHRHKLPWVNVEEFDGPQE